MYEEFREEVVNLDNKKDSDQINAFLIANDLLYEPCDYTVRIMDHTGALAGTGSVDGAIIKGVAVGSEFRETVVFAKIVTHLLEYLAGRNIHHVFVFTKPASVQSFKNLGFTEIERAEPLFAVLEYGVKGIKTYQDYLKKNKIHNSGDKVGGIVVNCNPFTLGHRYVIETAAGKCDALYVFVVQEERSTFPFKLRYELIEKGTADLKNVRILKGGDYIISSSTFPSYFLKNESESDIARYQAELDVRIFARHIAPVLHIQTRFVGTEDYCATTAAYNEAMKHVLPEFHIGLEVITRKRLKNDLIISASHVRNALKQDDWDLIKSLVPKTTYDFLKSPYAVPIIKALKAGEGRH
ncbi:[citrate (pro-3S)-lyase] ligase [Thermoproteota archaeon]